jgi:hypothetical protein
MHTELAEVGVLLQAPHRVDRLQIHLADTLGATPLVVLEAGFPLLDEPLQGPVDGVASDLQVAGDGFHAPSPRVELHERRPALFGIRDLVIGWIVPLQPQRPRLLREDLPHRADVGSPTEADEHYARDLVGVEGRVLGLEIHDEPADVGR